jgi:hypothetical protein
MNASCGAVARAGSLNIFTIAGFVSFPIAFRESAATMRILELKA